MRVIARKTLKQFVERLKGGHDQRAVKTALDSWFHEVSQADWSSPADVVRAYRNASIVGPDRVVLSISKERLQVSCGDSLPVQIVFIKWIGTHAEYDKIDVGRCNMEIKPIRSESMMQRAYRGGGSGCGVAEG